MRGIVISPIKITGENSLTVTGMDPIKLRQYLLYWDKIDFPQSNIFGFGSSPDVEYLKNVGVLKQTEIKIFLNGELTDLYLEGQLQALKLNNEAEKGCWTLGQENIDLVLPKDESVMERGVELNLYNSLPIPSAEVSLEDILLFKEKRKEELLEFRFLMDNFYQELLKSGDSERAMTTYIQRIEKQIDALDKTMKESVKSTLWGNLKVRFDVGEIIKNMAIGAVSASAVNWPVAAGAAVGLASSIKLSSEVLVKPKSIPTDLKDYAYLYYAKNELR